MAAAAVSMSSMRRRRTAPMPVPDPLPALYPHKNRRPARGLLLDVNFAIHRLKAEIKLRHDSAKLFAFLTFCFIFFALVVVQRNNRASLVVETGLLDVITGQPFDEAGVQELDDVGSQADMYDYIENVLLTYAFEEEQYNGDPKESHEDENHIAHYLAEYNRIVYGIMLVQERVKTKACHMSEFDFVDSTCFSAETDVDTITLYDDSANSTDTIFVSTYDSGFGGQLIYLDEDTPAEKNMMRFNAAKNYGWTNRQTRKVRAIGLVYNPSLRIIGRFEVAFHFSLGGRVQAKHSVGTVWLSQYSSPTLQFLGFLEVIVLLSVIWHAFRELGCIAASLRRGGSLLSYFSRTWNWIDLGGLGLFGIVVLLRIVFLVLATNFSIADVDVSPGDTESFNTLRSTIVDTINLIDLYDLLQVMNACTLLLLFVRLFKYMQFSPRMSYLTRTLEIASTELFWFIITFVLILTAFGGVGFLLYGHQLDAYATVGVSMKTCLRMVFGDFDVESMEHVSPNVTTVYFWSFMIFVAFIIANLFIAIIVEGYMGVKEEVEKAVERRSEGNFSHAREMLVRFAKGTRMMNKLRGGGYYPRAEELLVRLEALSRAHHVVKEGMLVRYFGAGINKDAVVDLMVDYGQYDLEVEMVEMATLDDFSEWPLVDSDGEHAPAAGADAADSVGSADSVDAVDAVGAVEEGAVADATPDEEADVETGAKE